MIYRSNLVCPDLTPCFKLLVQPRPDSMGHDVPSDPDFERECGFFTHDEAAILHHVALRARGNWIDIGARTGWTTAHIALALPAEALVMAVDPALAEPAFLNRYQENTEWARCTSGKSETIPKSSNEMNWFHASMRNNFAGVCIDGDHDAPRPLLDAQAALHSFLTYNGVVVMHDFWGEPIQQAVTWLMMQGMAARIYDTPRGVALCYWADCFEPPDHVPDPRIDWERERQRRAPTFDFGKCS